MLKFNLYQVFPDSLRVDANFDNEPDPRKWLLHNFLEDMYGQEDLYLGEIAKAEAGETILDLYNQLVDVQLYPDGRVILEEMRWSDDDEAELGPPARTEITLAEAKQLILDWLAAKKEWQAQRAAAKAATAGV
jgi:hypothetical protein